MTETKLNQNQKSEAIKDESYFPKNTQSEEECSLGNLAFGGQVNSNLHISIEHPKTTYKVSECNLEFCSIKFAEVQVSNICTQISHP